MQFKPMFFKGQLYLHFLENNNSISWNEGDEFYAKIKSGAGSDHLSFIRINKNIFCGGSVFNSELIVYVSYNICGEGQDRSNPSLFNLNKFTKK